MNLFEDELQLPDGLWVVKWIDKFGLGRGFISSPYVHLDLQKLEITNTSMAEQLSQEDVGFVIGRPPRANPVEKPLFTRRRVLVGSLPLLRIGSLVEGTRVVGDLPQREAMIQMTANTPIKQLRISDLRPAPDGWTASQYRVLNGFEYQLDWSSDVMKSECLVIKLGNTEYLIPSAIILKTFFGFHTKLANAICGGPWPIMAKEVISTANFDSGIKTYVDHNTGAWHIVMQPGFTKAHAARLALLFFDNYARRCAEAIYTNALIQTQSLKNKSERYWFANARIPYQLNNKLFKMRVHGFPLRPFRLSITHRSIERFLVTSIDATSWPLEEQEIHWELANSNADGEEAVTKTISETYYPRKPLPVPADENAEILTLSDPYALSADNIMTGDDFCFLNEPTLIQQTKMSHKRYLGRQVPPTEPPSLQLSAGNPSYGKSGAGILIAISKDRRYSNQLDLMINAITELKEDGKIEDFAPVLPPLTSHLRHHPTGICWTFISEEYARKNRLPSRGWEVFVEEHPSGDRALSTRYPRGLLIVQVLIKGRRILIFEIESKKQPSGYRTYFLESTHPISMPGIQEVLLVIRSHEGRLKDADLFGAFGVLTSRAPYAKKHTYRSEDSTRNKVEIDANALFRALCQTLSD
jgi:hypothetical protein